MYIKEILEKINNMEFIQDYEGKENKITVKVVENENDNNVQIIINCNSWIGHNCIFNETYEYDDSIEKFFQDLHEQNLEDIENEIYDNIDV